MVLQKLNSAEALAAHLEGLLGRDLRLAPVALRAGPIVLRTTPSGFAGMARVVCGQQLSVASANAIWGRFSALPGALDAHSFLALDDASVRGAGFSGGKLRTLRAVAEAVGSGQLDFAEVDDLPADDAIAALTAIKGIGPWTAELYLMFCAAHPDIFPSGDLALRKAVGHALGMADMPESRLLAEIAAAWAPHRATAALLFWRYFAAMRDKEGVAV